MCKTTTLSPQTDHYEDIKLMELTTAFDIGQKQDQIKIIQDIFIYIHNIHHILVSLSLEFA